MSKADAEEHEDLLRQGVREMQARIRPATQRAPLHARLAPPDPCARELSQLGWFC